MADDGYDPRFDPAFQRGFEGEAAFPARQASTRPGPAAERIAPPPVAAPGEQQARVLAEGARRAQVTQHAGQQAQPQSFEDESRPLRRRSEAEPVERYDAPPVTLRTNPFLIAVLLIAIALIGGGVLIASRLDVWYEEVPTGPGFFLLQSLQFGAPLAVALGIATIIGVLFLFALRWRGRSED